jgi:hypothetical protein
MHHKTTGELLHLMDGLYLNIEDGLFEFAYRNDDDEQRQRAAFDLMRELRYRRSKMYWLEDKLEFDTEYDVHLDQTAQRMSEKVSTHFRNLLGAISERTASASGRRLEDVQLPISPYQITYNFLATCRTLDLEGEAAHMVQNLFERFVLDRLGTIYGECHQRLEDAGFPLLATDEDLASSA